MKIKAKSVPQEAIADRSDQNQERHQRPDPQAAALRAESLCELVKALCESDRESPGILTPQERRMLHAAQWDANDNIRWVREEAKEKAAEWTEEEAIRRAAEKARQSVPYQGQPFPTVKAAMAAGFILPRPWHYGGEEITLKKHVLVRGAREALSQGAWESLGFRVKPQSQSHRLSDFNGRVRWVDFPIYRADQVVPTCCRGAGEPRRTKTRVAPLYPYVQAVILSPDVLRWQDGTVRCIAQYLREEGTFPNLSILHDALLDAGCDDEIILAHCRSGGPHLRNCWVIELLLGHGRGGARGPATS